MLFCPHCGNLLLVEATAEALRFFCQTCPYTCNVKSKVEERLIMKQKNVEDAMGTAVWEGSQRITVPCPAKHCSGSEAYFKEFATRGADEPTTQFFKCLECGEQWKEG
eukprot:GGOE01043036.1.p4 GENE.GGOE01043036.1~~GGOE01043036.1.p4  ORF type:complete len:108 (+),score=39.79 GGOE01043036.1:38-361(+)